MKDLIWFANGDHVFGICPHTPPRVIADCLSSTFPVPFETDAVLFEDRLSVGDLLFYRVEKPKNPYHYNQIYLGASLHLDK
ncbi:MAG: hypothetical protein HC852_01725 [Acaryochloridaceae cyanobacterium RU_4_10]|nr:hypothetical protein [Acaryochloridaceae cyanobacterium RU_4_10]